MPFPSITQMYEDGWKSIVQPPKLEYSIEDLGSPQFTAGSNIIKRNDFTLTNKRGNTLACSFFENTSSSSPLPCILYLHANGSFRLEALQYKHAILSQNFHLFCFDFSGCGLSTGEYCSLGHFEQEDIEHVVEYLNQTNKVTKIVLWGRSMGAVAAIMYSSRNPAITCLVLDSAFADFKRLVHEFIKIKTHIPGFIISAALALLRRTIRNKAGFDIYDLQTIEYIKKVQTPVLLGAPKDDTFVSPQHTKDLYNAHTGTKQLSIFEGEHNSQRPFDWIMAAINFIKSHVNEKTHEVEEIIQPDVSNIKKVEEIADNIGHDTKSPEAQIANDSHEAKGL